VFVNSMSDLFHKDVPAAFQRRVFYTMAITQRHTYQVLTKRPKRMRNFMRDWTPTLIGNEPLPNVWLGTSIESDTYTRRADHLRETPAAVRFISAEPLLGPLRRST
jgi:protein gp37